MARPDYQSWVGWMVLEHPQKAQTLIKSDKLLHKTYLEYTNLPEQTWESEVDNSIINYAYCLIDDEERYPYSLPHIICGSRAGWDSTEFIIPDESVVVHKWGITSRYTLYDYKGFKGTKLNRAVYPLPKLDNMQKITLKDLREALDRPIDGEIMALTTHID